MPLKHILLLILVSAIWGFNYVAIKIGLNTLPPLMFSALRFSIVLFPAIFFVKKPPLPLWKLALYGIVAFVFQQALLFSSMQAGLSAGLASLLFQLQAFFTIGLASIILRERPLLFQILGLLLAASGVTVVGFHIGGEITLTGLGLMVVAALFGGIGNMIAKNFGKIDMIAVVVWGSLFAVPPLIVLSLIIEGPQLIQHAITTVNENSLLALAYIAYLTTLAGYTIWNKMLSHYPAALVAPFSLLTPAFGLLSASIFLGEDYPVWKFHATLLIITGLCLNQFGGRLQKWLVSLKNKAA